MIVRAIKIEDAKKFTNHLSIVDQETQFLLFDPGERILDTAIQENRIKQLQQKENQTILIAEHDNRIIGHIAYHGWLLKPESTDSKRRYSCSARLYWTRIR